MKWAKSPGKRAAEWVCMERLHIETDVLIIGAGGAGMAAALAATEQGARVLLADRSLIGRGGATIMAQMTVAVALGEEVPDSIEAHFNDTIAAGRGLCDPRLAALVTQYGPEAIRRMDGWHVGWARHADGRIKQAHAPGHDRPRCVYVDFLSTGPAVSKTLRGQVQRHDDMIRRAGDLLVTDLVVEGGRCLGAVGIALSDGRPVSVAAGATIIATGGLTRLYARNSASANMGGDGYALALRAGATLLDMEFVQFFPIGHLAPRMIGMDPIMWDPFRYKLGGELLNGEMKPFLDEYGETDGSGYVVTRDKATYAILREVAAGRGSPHGGAWLSFRHVPEAELRAAFGPVIEKLAANGIDLTRQAIEVAPIAHYHMGGVRVTPELGTGIADLFAAGEAIGGSNGANRLSGNAITEALVFGEKAGRLAALRAGAQAGWSDAAAEMPLALVGARGGAAPNLAAMLAGLQTLMATDVGPFRTEAGLARALGRIRAMRVELGEVPPGEPAGYAMQRIDWFDLRTMLLVAETVTVAALARQESRGAHQREDFPGMLEEWTLNQTLVLRDGRLELGRQDVPTLEMAA
jgi:succinate dehydrogenase / fumarate reductase, flavoprotein subunit